MSFALSSSIQSALVNCEPWLVSLLLAALGIYGVVAYRVSCQRKDIGVRMALGAPRGRVQQEVLGWGLRLILPGALIGLALAPILGRALSGFLIEVGSFDPVSLLSASALMAGAALAATVLPAWRASELDPNDVLCSE